MKIKIIKKNSEIIFNKSFKVKKKTIKYKNHLLIIFGNCYDKITNNIFKNIKKVAQLNGEFFFIYRKNDMFVFGNSATSYFQLFYENGKDFLNISSDIFSLIKKDSSLNHSKIAEWLYLNGRSLDKNTFIKKIYTIHPGTLLKFQNKKLRLLEIQTFHYKKNNKKQSEIINDVKKKLSDAIEMRVKNIKSNITFGLSGGYDSRIILGLFPNNYKKKIKTVTIGDKYSLEKISAKKVASLLKVYHLDLKIKKDFYLKDPSKILNYGNYNNIFKNGTKEEIYSKIFKKNKSNFFIQGNALDVLIASSFSIKKLFRIKSIDEFLNWYLKTNELFSLNEINKIFNNNSHLKTIHIKDKLRKRIKKIKFANDFVDLNDALTFDLRIKRWHNSSLSVFIPIINMLIPTYDKNFLNACSKIPSNLRIGDKFRVRLLKNINFALSKIPKPENLSNKIKYRKYHTYDSDTGNHLKKSKKFYIFYKYLVKDSYDELNSYLNLEFINLIIKNHVESKKNNQRKIFMIITLLLFIKKFNDLKNLD